MAGQNRAHPGIARVPAGEKGSARRAADRTVRIPVGEARSLARQPVERIALWRQVPADCRGLPPDDTEIATDRVDIPFRERGIEVFQELLDIADRRGDALRQPPRDRYQELADRFRALASEQAVPDVVH